MCTLHQQLAQIRIAALGDPQLRIASAALSLPGPQAQESRHIAAVREPLGPAQRKYEGHRSERADPRYAGQTIYLGLLTGQLANLLIIVSDLLG